MPDVLQPARLMEDILSSYEQRIEGVQSIFDTTRIVLADFQEGADQARDEQELIHRQLRDVLARNEHLRNKDYDLMIQRIVEPRREQEKEIRALLNEFLAEQQRLAASLKECYGQIRNQLAKGDTPKILDLLKSIKELLAEQDQCKEELTSNLREAQADQQATVMLVKQLLVKGNTLRIKDFKDMLAHLQDQGKERIARKFKRREEVRRMIAGFKQQRLANLEEQRRSASPHLGATSSRHSGMSGHLPLGDDVRMKEAFEAIRWSQHPQGGEQTNNMVQDHAPRHPEALARSG